MKKVIVSFLLIWLSALMVWCNTTTNTWWDTAAWTAATWWEAKDTENTIAVWDTIQVNYVWSLQKDGSVFDTSIETVAQENEIYNPQRPYEPLEFTVGAGQMIPWFDKWVVGMSLGESQKLEIPAVDAYGEKTDEAIQEIPSQPFIDAGIDPVVGEKYNFGIAPGTVLAIGSGTLTVDFNHFLAWEALIFDVTIEWINKSDPTAVTGAVVWTGE